ncbi:hypothetical protein [Paracoccus lutimaris]|jgi:hypothetical protein|uniref:Uncharacterized protein n=1 Tax=Paracoccus lutimaris TaxID=1490030 RepID=A0A368YKE4_9RHOB|nr:hypothetical protein [Paracoccus lutimaris]RCW80712.1 hypothetical protein DFP89_11829 [Paracoccus lutimaris]
MTAVPSEPQDRRPGRSTVLDIGREPPLRRRPWMRRRMAVAAVLGGLVLLGWIVATEWLRPAGIGYLLYAAHDRIWLPLWSWLWLRSGYWSLLWFGPVAVMLLLALTEFLGFGTPLRRLQVAALRYGLRHNWTRALIGFQQILRWKRGHEGLLVAVIDSELRQAEAQAKAAIEAGRAADVTMLCRMTIGLAYLRANAPPARTRCAEQHLLAALLEPDKAAALRSDLRRIWGDETAGKVEAMTMIPDEAIPDAASGLSAPGRAPADLALSTLGVVRRAVLSQPDAASAWFTQWALQRYHPDLPREDLAQAEGMIDFEFWAAVCERAQLARARPVWLAGLLPGVDMDRPLGEVAAIARARQPLVIGRMNSE